MATDNFDLDDLDSILDSLDDSEPEGAQSPKELGTRKAIESIASGMKESIVNRTTAAKQAAIVADNALPDGYKAALEGADHGASYFMGLYNDSMKTLEKPLKGLRKALADSSDELPEFLGERFKSILKSWRPDEEGAVPENKTAFDADQLRLDAALKSVFGAQRVLAEQNALVGEQKASTDAKADLYNSSSIESTRLILDQVSRLVGYNDTVNYKWQQKSLELQHLQYFAQRDLLRIFTTYAKDTDVQLESIIHNTALPEIVKIKGVEGFMQSQKQRLYGNVGDSLETYQDQFFGKTKENLKGKVDTFVKGLAANLSEVTDLIGSDTGFGDLSLEEKLTLGGGLAGDFLQSTVGEKLSSGVGRKLKSFISRSPSLKQKSNELMYLFENFPSVFNEELKNWDGKVLPQSLLDKIPALSALEGTFIKEGLRDIIPRGSFSGLSLEQTQLDDMASPVTWSELERRSLVDIIPSFLSRQLQELEQIRTGQAAERQVYSFKDSGIVRQSEAEGQLQKTIFGDQARNRDRYADALVRLLGAGSGVELSEEANAALRAVLLQQAQSGKAFNIERLKGTDFGNDNVTNEILSMIEQSKGNISQRNLSGARIQKELTKGQQTSQAMLNFATNSGQMDLLKSMGLIAQDEFGEWKVVQDTEARMSYGQEAPDAFVTAKSYAHRNAPSVSDIGQFMQDQDGIMALPVFIPSTAKDIDAELLDTTRTGFSDQIALLDAILGGILRLEEGSGGKQGEPGERGGSRVGGFIKSTLSGIGDFTRGWYGGIADFTRAGGSAIGSILGGVTGRFGKRGESDVYVAGQREPAIRASLLKRGFYRNKETGEPIFSIDDIDGDVVDANGNVVITQDDVDAGIYLANGLNVTDIFSKGMGFVKDHLTSAVGFQNMLMNKMLAIPKAGYDAITKQVRDIYVRGEKTPRLQAILLKNGSYFSSATGKPIYRAEDIDGEVVDKAGNLVISNDDLVTGLVDNIGTPIGGNRLVQLAKNITSTGMDLASRLAAFSVEQGNRVVAGTYDFFSGIKDTLMGGVTINKTGYAAAGDSDYVKKIYEHMRQRWPVEEDSVYSGLDADRDDDGIRDNSWQDILSREEESDDTAPIVEEPKREEKSSGGGLLSLIMPLVSSITSGFGSMMEALKGIGTTIAAWFSWNKATATGEAASDILGDITDVGGGKKGGGKKGFMSKLWGGAKNLIGKGLNLAKGAAPLAMMAGKKVLTAGAAAAATVAGAPVLATAATVAGIAYTGYEIYGYFSKRTKPEPLERLRFLMYGINPDNTDDVVKIRDLESDAIDEVSFTANGPTFALTIAEATKRYAKNFGVDGNSAAEQKQWAEWFAGRFFPVFMVNLNQARAIDKNIDLLDIDDELDPKRRPDFVKAISSPANYLDAKAPWNNSLSPYPGKASPIKPSDVSMAILNLTSKAVDEEKYEGEMNEASVRDKVSSSAIASRNNYTMSKPKSYSYSGGSKEASEKVDSFSGIGQMASRGGLDPAIVGASSKAAAGGSIKMILPCEGRISSPYGMRVHPIKGTRKMHKGIDIAAPKNTPIVAAADGIIYRLYVSKSYGKVIYIKHPNGMATRYAHMNAFADGLAIGDKVKQGQLIGYVGNTGASAGDHLHWEVRVSSAQWADTIDPLSLVAGNVKADLAKEEKAIVKEEKEGEKETVEDTLEGQDTIRSTLLPKSVENNKDLPTKVPPASNSVAEKEKERKQAVESVKQTATALSAQTTEMAKSFKQREVMIANQAASLEKLDAIYQALVDLPGHISKATGEPISKSRTRSTSNRVTGAVNLTD